jgi:hypothetical protein
MGPDGISGLILLQVTSLTKDYDFVVVISGKEKMKYQLFCKFRYEMWKFKIIRVLHKMQSVCQIKIHSGFG